MIKLAGKIEIDLMTYLINQIMAEGLVSVVLDRGNYGELKLTGQNPKVVQKTAEKLIRQQFDINKVLFSFMPGGRTKDAGFI